MSTRLFAGCLLFVAMGAQAAAPSSPRRVIVHFENDAMARHARADSSRAFSTGSRRGVTHVRSLAAGGEVFELEPGMTMESVAHGRGVVDVEEDIYMQALRVTDPLWKKQWSLHDAKVGMDVEVAWKRTKGEGTVVAVLDTGIVPHPDLDSQRLPGYDFISEATDARDGDGRDADPADEGDWNEAGQCGARSFIPSSWHGSHVAGIAVGRQGNGQGIAGVAPEAKVLPVRVLGACGGATSDIADAIVWASGGKVKGVPLNPHRADVINLSLGSLSSCGRAFSRAISKARANGSVVVVAAGNSSVNVNYASPANCPGVVAVAALGRKGDVAGYSNFGKGVTLSAPGGSNNGAKENNVVSSVDAGERGRERAGFSYYAGTSMAAPHVAGLVALMRAVDPAISVDAVMQQLMDNARPLPGRCTGGCGAGLADAGATVDAVSEDRSLRVR
ncbi:serine protease [Luteibacter sp. Sphag1AF]|uniref:S8 family peptidase n=1 Tax=Luteibacter sp. Sphag1AF TaxID=2587031 RepID=UPI001614DB3D|nr:S8 family peptidase [Luteibacter sp. Sphag1AF]MBB3225509.1 serine protease [Luteibacter sp. Sphag1AF]